MNQGQETPIQEAVSLITIGAILLGVACYVACLDNAAVISPALFWLADQVYKLFPALLGLRSPQMPMLVASASVGMTFWLIGVPLAPLLARLFNASHIASLERQTMKLKRNRARIIKQRRDRDNFDVS